MQNLIVFFIVLAACFYVGRSLFRTFRSGESSCGCADCDGSGCPSKITPQKKEKR